MLQECPAREEVELIRESLRGVLSCQYGSMMALYPATGSAPEPTIPGNPEQGYEVELDRTYFVIHKRVSKRSARGPPW